MRRSKQRPLPVFEGAIFAFAGFVGALMLLTAGLRLNFRSGAGRFARKANLSVGIAALVPDILLGYNVLKRTQSEGRTAA